MSRKLEYLLVKKKDDFCTTVEQFQNLLLTNMRLSIAEDILFIGNDQVKFSLIEKDIEKTNEISFYLCFESSNCSDEGKEIEALETADKVLRRILEKYSNLFYINTIWDDVSTYYGIKAYPRINSIENKLRKIIYIFMIRNVGSKWVEKNIPKPVKESIMRTQERNNIHNMLEDCLFSADFIQLVYFFFDKYPIYNDIQKLMIELKKDNADIDLILEKYESKSNWDRYFAGEIHVESLFDKLNTLYSFRNKVAHNKRIDKEDYTVAINILDELDSAFNRSLERVYQIELAESEQNAVEAMAAQSIEKNLVNDVQYATSVRLPTLDMSIISELSKSMRKFGGIDSELSKSMSKFGSELSKSMSKFGGIDSELSKSVREFNKLGELPRSISNFATIDSELSKSVREFSKLGNMGLNSDTIKAINKLDISKLKTHIPDDEDC